MGTHVPHTRAQIVAYLALRVLIAVLFRLLLILFIFIYFLLSTNWISGQKIRLLVPQMTLGLALSRRFDFIQSSSGTGQDLYFGIKPLNLVVSN